MLFFISGPYLSLVAEAWLIAKVCALSQIQVLYRGKQPFNS